MKNWESFIIGQKREVKFFHPFSKLVVNAIGADLPSFLKIPSRQRTKRTEYIMDALSILGKERGFKSMSHGISDKLKDEGYFKKVEWLYDLHWYEEKKRKKYQQTSLPLVVECEWAWIRPAEKNKLKKKKSKKPGGFGDIKWDFQKLLVANSDLRVLIFRWRTEDSDKVKEKLDNYFTETITGYRNLPVGSKFLFVAFDKDGFWYSEKIKA